MMRFWLAALCSFAGAFNVPATAAAQGVPWVSTFADDVCTVQTGPAVPWRFVMRAGLDGRHAILLTPSDGSAITDGARYPARLNYGGATTDVTAIGARDGASGHYVIFAQIGALGLYVGNGADDTPLDVALTANGRTLFSQRLTGYGEAFGQMRECIDSLRADIAERDALAAARALRPLPPRDADGNRPLVPFSSGWVWGEAGNNCVARLERPDGSYATMALTKWNDLSDSLHYWRPGLASMADPEPGDDTPQAEIDAWEAAAERGWGVAATIDGTIVSGSSQTRMAQTPGNPRREMYRIGLRQQAFLDALATGSTLTIARDGATVDSFPVAGSRELAALLRQCVADDPSF